MDFWVVYGMGLLLLSILSGCCSMKRLQCMHRIIMADLYALGFLLGSGGWGFFGSKGANKVRSSRVHFQSQKFDNAEIVE